MTVANAPGLRMVQGYELDAVADRVSVHDTRLNDHASRLRTIELEGERTRTAMRFWGTAVIVATPILASFGAWIVVRVTSPAPSSSPASSAAVTSTATSRP